MSVVNQLPIPDSPEAKEAIAVLNSIQNVGYTVITPNRYTSQQDLFILFKSN